MIRIFLFIYFVTLSIKVYSERRVGSVKVDKSTHGKSLEWEHEDTRSYFSGLSIGFAGGYQMIANLEDATFNNIGGSGPAFSENLNVPRSLEKSYMIAGNLGFNFVFFRRLFMALEFDASYRFANHDSSLITLDGRYTYYTNHNVFIPFNFAGVLKIGLTCGRNLIYVLGGYDVIRFEYNYSYSATFTNNTGALRGIPIFLTQQGLNNAIFIHGYRVGLGIERVFYTKGRISLSFNVECYYRHYFNKDMKMGDTFGKTTIQIGSLNGISAVVGFKIRFNV